MQLAQGRPLVFIATAAAVIFLGPFAVVVRAHEFHLGHAAVHATALSRRERPRSREHLKRWAEVDATGRVQASVGLHHQRDQSLINITTELKDMVSEYTGFIGVGTAKDGGPQFQARVVFDTGSTNLWVASVLCETLPCSAAERRSLYYDPDKSVTQETFDDTKGGRDIDIMFGTGELRGPLHVDTYMVGPMVVKKQPFAMIREMNGDVFSSFPFEGILGLGFRSLSWGGLEPFFERVIDQKLLNRNEFAFFLNSNSALPSAVLWGGVDKALFEGPIRMFPVVQPHYWALELVDFRLGDKSLVHNEGEGMRPRRVIVDTGTTYFTMPSWLRMKLQGHLPEASCEQVLTYQPLVYVLRSSDNETFELKITQNTYMVGNGDHCSLAFMELDIPNKYGPAMILGEVFMRHFFTVFDRGSGHVSEAKVGFAPAKADAVPQVSPKEASFLQKEPQEGTSGAQGLSILGSAATMPSSAARPSALLRRQTV